MWGCSEYCAAKSKKMKKSLIAFIYSNGTIVEGDAGIMYDGPPPKALKLRGCNSMDALRERIHARLKLGEDQAVGKIVYRFPQHQTEAQYMAYELDDDEDLGCAIASYEQHPTMTAMELYVDVITSELRAASLRFDERVPRTASPMDPAVYVSTGCSIVGEGRPYTDGFEFHISDSHAPALDSSVAGVTPVNAPQTYQGSSRALPVVQEESIDPVLLDAHLESGFEDDEVSCSSSDDHDTDDEERAATNADSVPTRCVRGGNAAQTSYGVPQDAVFSDIDWDTIRKPNEFPEIMKPTYDYNMEDLQVRQEFDCKEALIAATKHHHIR